MRKVFTLIEVLIVTVIIGTLVAVGFTSYSTYKLRARDAKRKENIQLMKSAIVMYHSQHTAYPQGQIAACTQNSTYSTAWTALSSALQPYLSPLPLDPQAPLDSTGACPLANITSDYGSGRPTAFTYLSNVGTGYSQYSLWAQLENQNDIEANSATKKYSAFYGYNSVIGGVHESYMYGVGCTVDGTGCHDN